MPEKLFRAALWTLVHGFSITVTIMCFKIESCGMVWFRKKVKSNSKPLPFSCRILYQVLCSNVECYSVRKYEMTCLSVLL